MIHRYNQGLLMLSQELMNSEKLIEDVEASLQEVFAQIDEVKEVNTIRVLEAFKKIGVQASHFSWVTGYGHDDLGREKLDELFSEYFQTEAAIVRPHFVSGTHAISTAILGNLNSGDELVAIGKPYDTLKTVFKKFESKYKIKYKQIDFDFQNPKSSSLQEISKNTKLVFIQRSRGYEWRDSLSLEALSELILAVRKQSPDVIVFVDNCYGEFTQKMEPTNLDLDDLNCNADLIAGSLIKNPGGGIVAAGGYIAGRKDLVFRAAEELTAPGIGAEGGSMFDQTRLMFQGFFMAPLIVSEALKGMALAAKVFEGLGYETIPSWDAQRNDVIQAVKFGEGEEARTRLLDFVKIVQSNSPVNSMFTPIPDDLPGYEDQVVMGSGTFIEGSTIELSADAPIREPYIGYFQGGLSYPHIKYILSNITEPLKA